MTKDLLYIVMPVYNEEDNVRNVISQWYPIVEKLNNGSKLLMVNDGSRDNTYKIMYDLKEGRSSLEIIDKVNEGHGPTVLYCYRYAIEADADYIFQTDSDGQTNPDEFWNFWENRDKYDFQIGSRDQRQDGFGRVVVSRVLRLVIWLTFGEWVKDANTPFRLMKSGKLIPILNKIPNDFFLSNVAVSAIAVKWKERCLWTPITFKTRQGGINSINMKKIFKIGWKAVRDLRSINRNLK